MSVYITGETVRSLGGVNLTQKQTAEKKTAEIVSH